MTLAGLRPGEKLYEELLVKTEELDKTPNSMIFIERDAPLCEHDINVKLEELQAACNLLRDVVGRYVGNEPESLFALEEIQKTAALMRFELERGNVDGFASLLDYHWELSKKVDG